jgi:DNA-binding NarL/FixJ family response regulator
LRLPLGARRPICGHGPRIGEALQEVNLKVRILLADDHALVRYGLRALLEMSGAEVVGEADDGREMLRLARELEPDVAIVDVAMPGLNGIDAAVLLREQCPRTRIVTLSMHSSSEHVHRAFSAGASAYLLKGAASEEVLAAVQAVQAGGQYVSRELESVYGADLLRTGKASPVDSLSGRERQVLQLVVEGHSSSQIATVMRLSSKSIDTYRSRLMKKLSVSDIPSLVKFAVQHGLTPGG